MMKSPPPSAAAPRDSSNGQNTGDHAGRIHRDQYQRLIVAGQLSRPVGLYERPNQVEKLAGEHIQNQHDGPVQIRRQRNQLRLGGDDGRTPPPPMASAGILPRICDTGTQSVMPSL